MDFFLKPFFSQNSKLYVTEFGHSAPGMVKTVGPRSRETYLLHFIVKGSCDFSGFRAEEGQVFFISKESRHTFTISNPYEHFWIGFDGAGVEELFHVFDIDVRKHQLFWVENTELVKMLFEETKQKLRSHDNELSASAALSALTFLLPLLRKEKFSEMPRQINYAEKVRHFIQTNYMYPIKMTEIARAIPITEKYMCHLFSSSYGMAPRTFLLKTRMEAAAKTLTSSDLSVKEIAYSVGYQSIPSFSKAFTEYFGVSPTVFRSTR